MTTVHSLPPDLIHELRSPLNLIIGYSEMLIEHVGEAGNDVLVPDLQKVRAAGHKLLAVISENLSGSASVVPADAVGELAVREATPAGPTLVSGTPPAQVPAMAETEGLTFGATQGLILVVDDNEANRDLLQRRLERQGYTVATAENGRQALEVLLENNFDVVLLDIMLPEMDGYEVLQRVKADYRLQHIPVIMISALDDLDSVARCIEMGAEDYLPKPFNPIILKARIGACLEKKRSHDREVNLYEQLEQNFKRLQQLEKDRDDLTHMIIHDLRTPLTSVIAGMQTLDMVGDLNEDQQSIMEIAVVGGQTLLGMINDLLDIDKLESGGMQLELGPVSASELVLAAVRQVASLAESKDLVVLTEIEEGMSPFQGDESKLKRTLVNLLGNAIKFTPPGGTITVSASSPIAFSVRDTGEGIPAEAFERIFEKFAQVESRHGGRTSSSGLGLTFCKLAVEAHGGTIEVQSSAGEGSTFRFSIPAHCEQP